MSLIETAARRLLDRIRQREAVDPVAFGERIGFVADPWQADVLRSKAKRLLLNCCRQSGKTSTTALMAAHQALFSPKTLTLISAPSERQSKELLRKIRGILGLTPEPPNFDRNSAQTLEVENGSRIVALPATTQNLRGFSSPSLVLIDEASFCDDELFDAMTPMMAANSAARMVLLSTPNGKRGRFYQIWKDGDETEWLKVRITADQCPRIANEFLESERRIMPEFFFLQEYYCQFTDASTQIFATELIERAVNHRLRSVKL